MLEPVAWAPESAGWEGWRAGRAGGHRVSLQQSGPTGTSPHWKNPFHKSKEGIVEAPQKGATHPPRG